MHKNLLLCTAACALFFSSFTFTSISTASSLSTETRRALEGMIKLPEQYRYAIDVMSTPTQTEKNLEEITSSTMRGNHSHFNQVHQNSMDRVRRETISSSFSGTTRADSGVHHTVLKHGVDNIHTQVMANQYHQDIQSIADTGEKLNQLRIKRSALQKHASDKLSSADVASQHEDNSSLKTDLEITQSIIDPKTNTDSSASKMALNTSAESHVKLSTKIESIPTAHAENTSKLTDDKATTTSSSLDGAANRKTLTPQIENSFVMPIAMFAVGVSDANNQSILLDNMQITMFEPKEYQERSIFLSTYGNKNTFFSRILSRQESAQTEQEGVPTEQESIPAEQESVPAEQGSVPTEQEDVPTEQESVPTEQGRIHADIRYAALQAGATLIAREHQSISTNFGFFGTYGKLSFAPKNAESSHKKMFDKWSLTAYGNIQHDSGIYASAFLSYGIFKENMRKEFIKDTPKVKNSKILGAAATVGQKLSTGFEGVILEPQAQLVYQRLILGVSSDNNSSSNDNSSSDEENSKINIGNPDQWLLRIGGRLTQNKGHVLSFYGKLNLIKTFSKNFQLAAMGSLVEGGFGIQAHLSPNIELHSDLSYQHKFKKVGISGINISAGMRYHF
ncbi:autotransporter outer membrane beta-barrel domain-containing protein [Bartonella krasnovii]|uniref:Autotransporter outer membrane beta-barrel domain-containing protein n=1 Tax=Bartonella krasnovii TaxID=2267275 RepID=A0A5B9D241_9HYPH|nr:autotransporter outer membrane beta-barrel domain-containing protein [Bartonella krasnovii]QEE12522.1 autotransporter outer membrane beta-barrel domain-containing protein [Bartonella krasnovii]UNF53204.1 autotransporter outer membrane beta-barrel domain-containing protein [Bartonella krasnovii]